MFFYLKKSTQLIFDFFLNVVFKSQPNYYAIKSESSQKKYTQNVDINLFTDYSEINKELIKIAFPKQKNHWIHYIFKYRNTLIKNLIWQLKFKGQKNIAKILGHFIGEYILKLINESKIKNFIIIPVPIHRKRRLERGFNQTELISKYIKKYLNSKNINNFYVDTKNLKKIKETKKQSWKNKSERLKKNENIFYIKNKEIFNNKIIFIIDDVVTTGKTLQDIKEELNKTNPKKIIGICFAGG